MNKTWSYVWNCVLFEMVLCVWEENRMRTGKTCQIDMVCLTKCEDEKRDKN